MTGYVALPSMGDIERLERRIEKLEGRVGVILAYGKSKGQLVIVEDWHGKAKGLT